MHAPAIKQVEVVTNSAGAVQEIFMVSECGRLWRLNAQQTEWLPVIKEKTDEN